MLELKLSNVNYYYFGKILSVIAYNLPDALPSSSGHVVRIVFGPLMDNCDRDFVK